MRFFSDSALIKKELSAINEKLLLFLANPYSHTQELTQYVVNSGGKKIRPLLAILCGKLINSESSHRYLVACSCEYIHIASLLHDDVIDHAETRRNRPTLHHTWGTERAILLGDFIYSSACKLIAKTQNLELIESFADCITDMSQSEIFQLSCLWNCDLSIDDYYSVIQGKTSKLFSLTTKCLPLLEKMPTELVKLFEDLGCHIGYSFQIYDDYLDYIGDQTRTGKDTGSDIIEGKITLPILFALENKNHEYNIKRLISCIKEDKKSENGAHHIKELRSILKETAALDRTLEKAKSHVNEAKLSLNKIKSFLNIEAGDPRIDIFSLLEDAFDFIVKRDY